MNDLDLELYRDLAKTLSNLRLDMIIRKEIDKKEYLKIYNIHKKLLTRLAKRLKIKILF